MIYIYQIQYVKEWIKRFNPDEAKTIRTPMHPTTSLGLEKESNPVEHNKNI